MNLRIDRSRGPAPHKPLLLLAVADLAAEGLLPDAVLPLTPELAFRFQSFWTVVAARQRQRPDSRNNDSRNGLALSRNAHWAFDAGLWSLTDAFRILVADRRFHESGPDAHLLKPLAGTAIQLPRNPALHPDPRHLAWHRKRHGFASSGTGLGGMSS